MYKNIVPFPEGATRNHFPKPPRQFGLLSIGSSDHWSGVLATMDRACTPDLSSSASVSFTIRCLCKTNIGTPVLTSIVDTQIVHYYTHLDQWNARE